MRIALTVLSLMFVAASAAADPVYLDELDIEIGLTTPDAKDVYLTLDGQEGFQLTDRDRVCVRKSGERVLLVQSPDKDYFDVLRNQLKWGEG